MSDQVTADKSRDVVDRDSKISSELPSFRDCTLPQKGIYAVAVTFALFSLYFGISPSPGIIQQAVHLLFALILIFTLLQPSVGEHRVRNLAIKALDSVFLVIGAASTLYLILNYQEIIVQAGNLSTISLLSGGGLVLSVIYAAKKTLGWPMPILAALFLLYALFGQQLPSLFQHGGYGVEQIVSFLYITGDGIFGAPLKASATLVIFFLIFSAFFERTGGGTLVIQLAQTLFGRLKGGPAKVAVVASGLFGSISGSAVANVVGTGAITIPLMKRTGYRARFAGAVEAVASTGGQYMPPVMGAAAFIMAEILGTPYSEIAIAAILPAILFFLAVFTMVDLEARKLDIRSVPKSELPSMKNVMVRYGHMLIPLAALVYMLVFLRYSPARAAMFAVGLTIVFSFFRSPTRLRLNGILESLRNASTGVLQVAAACACAGVIIGVFSLTGLGLKLSFILIDLSGGNTLILLMLTAIASIILGMGMPTVGAYLVLAVLIAPVLIEAGVNPIAAHLFIFYFGNISNVTPPVALAAFAAAGLSGASPSATGWTASKLAISGFIIPFLFVYGSGLLLEGPLVEIAHTVVTATLGVSFLSIGLAGYLRCKATKIEQLLFIVGGLTLIDPGILTDIIGIGLGSVAVVSNVLRGKRHGSRTDESVEQTKDAAENPGGRDVGTT